MSQPLKPDLRHFEGEKSPIVAGPAAFGRMKTGRISRRTFYVAYRGPSMNPTLRHLDLLEVVPYDGQPVQPGDVVVAMPSGRETHVVHRVIRVDANGIRTQGDHNSGKDSWSLQPRDIIGRVVAAWRGQRRRRVPGGLRGKVAAKLARIGCGLDRVISFFLGPIYKWMAGILLYAMPSPLRPCIMHYRSGGRVQLRLQLRGWLIGEYDPKADKWRIKRPFRLIVDERQLPRLEDVVEP